MQKQPNTIHGREPSVPWSPLTVALISFLLPAGGAVLTIRNMARLQQIDRTTVTELTVVTMAVFAIGFTALLVAGQPDPTKPASLDANVSAVLSFGTAVASYAVQRPAFVVWRRSHVRIRTGPWFRALGMALIYTLLILLAVLPLRLLVGLVATLTGSPVGRV